MSSIQSDQLERALRYEPFAASDRVFCRLLKESFSEENAFVLAAASLCLSAVREGHSFFELAGPELPELLCEALGNAWPTVAEWASIAENSHSIGRPGDDNPLILVFHKVLRQVPCSAALIADEDHDAGLGRSPSAFTRSSRIAVISAHARRIA